MFYWHTTFYFCFWCNRMWKWLLIFVIGYFRLFFPFMFLCISVVDWALDSEGNSIHRRNCTLQYRRKASVGNTSCFRFHFLSHPPPGKVHRTAVIRDTSHSYLYFYGAIAEFCEVGRNINLKSLSHSGCGNLLLFKWLSNLNKYNLETLN
jgi:hypothetical protein